jgi:hypothetical protein
MFKNVAADKMQPFSVDDIKDEGQAADATADNI